MPDHQTSLGIITPLPCSSSWWNPSETTQSAVMPAQLTLKHSKQRRTIGTFRSSTLHVTIHEHHRTEDTGLRRWASCWYLPHSQRTNTHNNKPKQQHRTRSITSLQVPPPLRSQKPTSSNSRVGTSSTIHLQFCFSLMP